MGLSLNSQGIRFTVDEEGTGEGVGRRRVGVVFEDFFVFDFEGIDGVCIEAPAAVAKKNASMTKWVSSRRL